ncbi:hypothetical protein JD844_032908, partial [Phrynosoma platyrhinos]
VEANNCTIDVTVRRHTKYYKNSGDSASIECPVMYCQKKPDMHCNITVFDETRNTTEDHAASEKNKMLIIYILSSLGALGLLIFCCFGLLQSKRRLQGEKQTISSTLQIEMKEQFPNGSAVYSSQGNCEKPNIATSKPADDKSVTNQLSSANQDTLVYATLNHGEHFEKSEPFVEIEFTEYAAIVLKN